MFVAVDLDGTADAYPREMQSLMSALNAAGHRVDVVTGVDQEKPDETVLQEKADYLASLGCGQCYDKLVVVGHPPGESVAKNKVEYLKAAGCHVVIDNLIETAELATEAGILVLVPWGSKS